MLVGWIEKCAFFLQETMVGLFVGSMLFHALVRIIIFARGVVIDLFTCMIQCRRFRYRQLPLSQIILPFTWTTV